MSSTGTSIESAPDSAPDTAGEGIFIMQPMSQFNVVPGSNVQFSVTLGPLPTISMFVWRINGSQINGSQLNNKYTGLNTGRLTVLSVDESDEGLYTVEVLATIGDGNVSFSNISEPAWLTVCELCMYYMFFKLHDTVSVCDSM